MRVFHTSSVMLFSVGIRLACRKVGGNSLNCWREASRTHRLEGPASPSQRRKPRMWCHPAPVWKSACQTVIINDSECQTVIIKKRRQAKTLTCPLWTTRALQHRQPLQKLTPANWDSAQLNTWLSLQISKCRFPMECHALQGGGEGVKKCLFDLWEISKKTTVQKDPSFMKRWSFEKSSACHKSHRFV